MTLWLEIHEPKTQLPAHWRWNSKAQTRSFILP